MRHCVSPHFFAWLYMLSQARLCLLHHLLATSLGSIHFSAKHVPESASGIFFLSPEARRFRPLLALEVVAGAACSGCPEPGSGAKSSSNMKSLRGRLHVTAQLAHQQLNVQQQQEMHHMCATATMGHNITSFNKQASRRKNAEAAHILCSLPFPFPKLRTTSSCKQV